MPKQTLWGHPKGLYILFFTETNNNHYEAQEFIRFSMSTPYVKSFNFTNSVLTVNYEEAPCGGQFENCGTKFTKKFKVEDKRLYQLNN